MRRAGSNRGQLAMLVQPSVSPASPLPAVRWTLWAAFGIAVAIVLGLAALGRWDLVMLVPLVAMAPLMLIWASRSVVVNFAVLLALFSLAARNEAGIGLVEVIFALYYVPYLLLWYGTRLLVYRESIIQQRGDWAVVALLLLAGLGFIVGVFGGGRLPMGLAEIGSFSLLAFYFPFREFCVRRGDGLTWMLVLLVGIGLVAVFRNLSNFTGLVETAIDLRGVAGGRVVINEVLIFFSAAAAAAAMLYAKRAAVKWAWFAAFLLCGLGVVVTQFRAFYLGLAVALGLAFVLIDGRRRVGLAATVGISLLGMLGLGYILLGDLLIIFVVGVTERMLSIGTATQMDESLINRFFEYQEAWKLIRQSPIIGHGFGVEFSFFDSIFKITWVKSYIHNGYLHLLYKLGIVGLGLFIYICGLAVARGLSALRSRLDDEVRGAGLFVVISLAGLAVAALATVLFNSDTMLPLAMCLAIGAALDHRNSAFRRVPSQLEEPPAS